MSYFSYFFSLIILLLIFSCAPENLENTNNKKGYQIITKTYKGKSNPCPDEKGSCAEINLIIPFIEKNEKADFINQDILKEIEGIFENLSPSLTSLKDIPLKIDSFISQHKRFSKEIEFPQNWTFNIHYKLLENNKNSLSILINTEGYLGGAHPFNEVRILSYDIVNEKRLQIIDFIKDENKLKDLIVNEFRRKRKLSASYNLKEVGFYSNEWPIPKNFALLSQGLYLVYNPYEIGPYVLGSTELLIPFDEIKPLLKN